MTRVFLTGFMGAGKNTVGRLLAREMGWPYHDLDAAIEAAAGMPIPEIFRAEGEAGFRRREAEALRVQAPLPGVHSLGGGALLDPSLRALLRPLGPVVYLRAAAATLARRLARGAGGRPMLAGEGPRAQRVETLLAARAAAYQQADWTVDTDGIAPAQVAQGLARRLRESP